MCLSWKLDLSSKLCFPNSKLSFRNSKLALDESFKLGLPSSKLDRAGVDSASPSAEAVYGSFKQTILCRNSIFKHMHHTSYDLSIAEYATDVVFYFET